MIHPQYLASTDPQVVAAIKANQAGYDAFRQRARDWAIERDFEDAVIARTDGWHPHPGCARVIGLPGVPTGRGEWTKVRSGTSHPKRGNTVELDTMKAITHISVPVPGLPTHASRPATNGMTLHLERDDLTVGGTAYVRYSELPVWLDGGGDTTFGSQWHEILATDFARARTAWLRSRGA